MVKLLTASLLILLSGCSSTCTTYGKVGAGYKFDEIELIDLDTNERMNDPLTARFELGKECAAWSYGVSHHSQWLTGKPFNNKDEYSKSELFIDYKWEL